MTCIAGLLAAPLAALPAAAAGPGTAAADFLRIPVGARETALGGAFTAAAAGANAVFYNPAGLSGGRTEFTYTYNNYLPGISQHWAAVAAPAPGGNLGLGVNYLSVAPFDSYDAADNRTGSVSAYGLAAGLGYAGGINTGLEMLPSLRLGAAFKYISESLDSRRASGYGLDAGLQLKPAVKGLLLGAAVENLSASRLEFISGGARPARNVKAGAAYNAGLPGADAAAMLALDANFPEDGGAYLSAGLETLLYGTLALRAGYSAAGDVSNGLTFGLGVELAGGRRGTRLDYSYAPSYDLGNIHKFGVTMRFGRPGGNGPRPAAPAAAAAREVSAEADFQSQLDLLYSGSYKDALAAAEYLAALGDARVPEHFISLLYSPDMSRRLAAARGLSLRVDARSLEGLETALGDKEPEVRRVAAAALGERGSAASAAALQEALRRETSEQVKSAIIAALGRLAPPEK